MRSVENNRGEWVPAIPLPYYVFPTWFRTRLRYRYYCTCYLGFKTEAEYRGHYALVHILGLD